MHRGGLPPKASAASTGPLCPAKPAGHLTAAGPTSRFRTGRAQRRAPRMPDRGAGVDQRAVRCGVHVAPREDRRPPPVVILHLPRPVPAGRQQAISADLRGSGAAMSCARRPLVKAILWRHPIVPRRRHLECGRIARSRRGGRGRAGDLGPCRPGPTPAEPPRGSANVKIAQGKGNPEGNRGGTGTGQWPKGTNRRTPDEGNQRKADEGEEPGGQPGNRRKARRGNRRPCDEAPDRPVRARGFGAAPIYDAAGRVLAGSARTAHSRPPAFRRARPSASRAPRMLRSPGAPTCTLCGLLIADGS